MTLSLKGRSTVSAKTGRYGPIRSTNGTVRAATPYATGVSPSARKTVYFFRFRKTKNFPATWCFQDETIFNSSVDKSNGFEPMNASSRSMLSSKPVRTFRRQSVDNTRNSSGLWTPGTISRRSLTKHINEECNLKNSSASSGRNNMPPGGILCFKLDRYGPVELNERIDEESPATKHFAVLIAGTQLSMAGLQSELQSDNW